MSIFGKRNRERRMLESPYAETVGTTACRWGGYYKSNSCRAAARSVLNE